MLWNVRSKARGIRMQLFDSLYYPNYRSYWLGSIAEHFGEYMELVALLWITNKITASPFLLTLVGSCRFLPMVFLSLPGGLAADWFNRCNLLIVSLLGSICLSVYLAVVYASGLVTVWHLIAISLLHGVAMSFNHPVRQSILPNLVESEHLINAISLETGSVLTSQAIAMPIAGCLIGSIGAASVFALRAALVLLTIWWLIPIRTASIPASPRRLTTWQDLSEAAHHMHANVLIFGLVALLFVPRLSTNVYTSLLPIFAVNILQIGPQGYGILQGAPGWGSLIAFVTLASFRKLRNRKPLVFGMAIITGILLAGFAESHWLIMSLSLLFLVGGLNTSIVILDTAMIQSIIPNNMRGKIMSLPEIIRGLGTAAALIFGAIGECTSTSFAILVLAGVCFFIPSSLFFLFPQRRNI
ncbi:MAG: MFS transporter [Deltaproteobacteria bacterium]|nr:MFS transporter [Deltaproteobacteria bacterium]